MRIGELAEKYHLDKRTIDYYTTAGLIPCKVLPNGYRDYDEESEQTLLKALILMENDFSTKEIAEVLKTPSICFKPSMINIYIKQMKTDQEAYNRRFNLMIDYAESLKKEKEADANA